MNTTHRAVLVSLLGLSLAASAAILKTDPAKSTVSATFKQMNVCLLYTSPSPRDRTRSRMPSSA